jgi:hypothetical protein
MIRLFNLPATYAYRMVTIWAPLCPVRGFTTPLPRICSTSPPSVSGGTTSSDLPSMVGTVTVLRTYKRTPFHSLSDCMQS